MLRNRRKVHPMTDREKLMKLIDELPPHEGKTFEEALADHLIANGVEIFSEEDEKVLEMVEQNAREAFGNMRYLQGVQFGVESAMNHRRCKFCEDYDKFGEIVCYLPTENGDAIIIPLNYCPNCGAKMDK